MNKNIVEIETLFGVISVRKQPDKNDTYDVFVDDAIKHPDCSHEDVFRALSNYMMSLQYKLDKYSNGQ